MPLSVFERVEDPACFERHAFFGRGDVWRDGAGEAIRIEQREARIEAAGGADAGGVFVDEFAVHHLGAGGDGFHADGAEGPRARAAWRRVQVTKVLPISVSVPVMKKAVISGFQVFRR